MTSLNKIIYFFRRSAKPPNVGLHLVNVGMNLVRAHKSKTNDDDDDDEGFDIYKKQSSSN